MKAQIDFYVYRYVGGKWALVGEYSTEVDACKCASGYPMAKVIRTISELIY